MFHFYHRLELIRPRTRSECYVAWLSVLSSYLNSLYRVRLIWKLICPWTGYLLLDCHCFSCKSKFNRVMRLSAISYIVLTRSWNDRFLFCLYNICVKFLGFWERESTFLVNCKIFLYLMTSWTHIVHPNLLFKILSWWFRESKLNFPYT